MAELTPWKQIADHLKVSIRTAQKYEKELGLPVHRIGGRVFARTEELDAWRPSAETPRKTETEAPTPDAPSLGTAPPIGRLHKWKWTPVAAIVALAILSSLAFFPRSHIPARSQVTKNTLVVSDERGAEIWRATFPDELDHAVYESANGANLVWIGDLDGDGTVETIFVLRKDERYAQSAEVICFSQGGKERWRFVPGKPVHTVKESFANVYNVQAFRVARLGNSKAQSIILPAQHYLYYPVQISILDNNGRSLQEYWHAGHLANRPTAFLLDDLDHDGKPELYLGGISQSRAQGTLVVLDPENMTGASRESDPSFQLQDLPLANERARVYFPRSSMNLHFSPYNQVTHLHPKTGGLTVDTLESFTDPGGPTVLYELDPSLKLLAVAFSDIFTSSHSRLQASDNLPSLEQERTRLAGHIKYGH